MKLFEKHWDAPKLLADLREDRRIELVNESSRREMHDRQLQWIDKRIAEVEAFMKESGMEGAGS